MGRLYLNVDVLPKIKRDELFNMVAIIAKRYIQPLVRDNFELNIGSYSCLFPTD